MLDLIKVGNVVIGTKQTLKTIKEKNAKLVYLARDVDKHISDDVESASKEYNVEIFYVDSMEELGKACGISRKTASAALTK
ncbi:MAG: 50S ribosomal protein L7ae-like protein [Eubacteriaceae bacterium]|nr:50S ribosomal protein L7ae-like protein [Eubacteriaceae bacterium]